MIKLKYKQDAILAMFFQTGLSLNPSTEQIQKFDANLFDADEETLADEMTKAGLDPKNVTAKSKILLYARMTGGGSLTAQVRRAIKFFKNTDGL